MKIDIEQFDERETVFAREDLTPGMTEYAEFYSRFPELKEADDRFRTLPGLGSSVPAADMQMFWALAAIMYRLGEPGVVDGIPQPDRIRLSPERAALKIKHFAGNLGADLVGISRMKPEYAYSHRGRKKYAEEPYGLPIQLDHSHAVSLGFAMDRNLAATGPRHSEMVGTGFGYYKSACVSVAVAEYIRSLGYPARAHHFRNYQVLPVPLAVDAGLGELGRCGFLVTKEYGNCLRLATVTTDLPLECDKPVDIGVQDFCRICSLCADVCPSGAIPGGEKTEIRGSNKWQLDAVKCITYWNKAGTDCGMCIGSCPWSLPDSWYHRLGTRLASKSHLARVLLLWIYPLLFGRYRPEPLPAWLDEKRQV